MAKYRRVLLKLSGEAFGGDTVNGGAIGVDPDVVSGIAAQIGQARDTGTEIAIVVGGGNFFRGSELQNRGMDRARADYIGMLGTVMNALALQDFCEQAEIDTRVQTAITMSQVAEPYIPRRAIRHLEKGRVVIFGAGSGMPFFSTDTVAAQRALEVECDVILMGKRGTDGVYDCDPRTNPNAVMYHNLTYDEYLAQNLKVADATAIAMAREHDMPMLFFNLDTPGNIVRAIAGESLGTIVQA